MAIYTITRKTTKSDEKNTGESDKKNTGDWAINLFMFISAL